MEELAQIADDIAVIESRVSDVIFDTVRSQLRQGAPADAQDLERRLTKVRRSLLKAEMLLRAGE